MLSTSSSYVTSFSLVDAGVTCESIAANIVAYVATYKQQYASAYGVDVNALYVSNVTCRLARGAVKTIQLTRAQGGRRVLAGAAAAAGVGMQRVQQGKGLPATRALQQAAAVADVDLSITLQLTDTSAIQRMAQLEAAAMAVSIAPYMQVGCSGLMRLMSEKHCQR